MKSWLKFHTGLGLLAIFILIITLVEPPIEGTGWVLIALTASGLFVLGMGGLVLLLSWIKEKFGE